MTRVIDERALWLARFVLPHEPAMRAWLRGKRLAGLDVDDVIQEAYTRLIAIDGIEHIRNPKAYAFQAASTVILDHIRRSKIVTFTAVSDMDYLNEPADEPSPESQVVDRDELMRLAEAIGELPSKIQAVFKLRRVDGLSQREVAERLGLAESTVEKHMSRGFLLMLERFGRGGKSQARTSMSLNPKLRRGHDQGDRAKD